MKKIAVEFTFDTDIIEVPDDIAMRIKTYQKMFDKWLYDKNIDHDYWGVVNGKKSYVAFDTEAFVKYLNEYHLFERKEKAKILEKSVDNIPNGVTTIWF